MAGIVDYLKWRGDLPLSSFPFNEVDGAVLACLAYIKFEATGKKWEGETLEGALKALLNTPEEKDNAFIKALSTSPRFSSMTILDYTSLIENESQTQFAAITLKDEKSGHIYLFYRGTDDTLLGLKEDFNMSFMTVIPGQLRALEYLEGISKRYDGTFTLGGHSKGGNFAVYASSFINAECQKRIEAIYNYDGPGFEESVIGTDEYRRICPLVQSFVPQTSIVGMMLEHEEKYTIVHSSGSGVGQHNINSWDVDRDTFVHLEEADNESRFIDGTLKSWLKNLDREKRGEFIDAVYTVMEKSGAKTLTELKSSWFNSGIKIVKGFRKLPAETRKTMSLAMSVLFKSSKESLKNLKAQDEAHRKKKTEQHQRKKNTDNI